MKHAAGPGALLSARGLCKKFSVPGSGFGLKRTTITAVEDVSLSVNRGEVLGIVGESGCGKSTVARLLMNLVVADSGEIDFDGQRIEAGSRQSVQGLRRNMQMVFQDSSSSLNPRMAVDQTIAYAPAMHGTPRRQALAEAHALLDQVGLGGATYGHRYPHELSGGQRQRVNIARALAVRPALVILDEAVAALDKSIEAQILMLLQELKTSLGLSYIFISHDLNVVEYMCDRVAVMYLGQVVETGPIEEIYGQPAHPYTLALMRSRLSIDPRRRTSEAPLRGEPPNPAALPSGCRFRTRCPRAQALCADAAPVLCPRGGNAAGSMREVACHFPLTGRSGNAA